VNKDIRIGTNYPYHPKIRKLRKLLGNDGVVSHIFLLCFVGQNEPGGMLKDMDVEDIAQAAQWKGNPQEFVDALVELRLLDRNSETYVIHNWLRHNLFAASAPKRSEIARANALKRWNKKLKVIQEVDAIGIADGNADSNAPSPSPSPSPSPRREGEEEGRDFALGEQSLPSSPKDLKPYLDWQQTINEQSDPDLKASWQKVLDRELATLSEEEQERISIMGESIEN
jgi:hypothetical protein